MNDAMDSNLVDIPKETKTVPATTNILQTVLGHDKITHHRHQLAQFRVKQSTHTPVAPSNEHFQIPDLIARRELLPSEESHILQNRVKHKSRNGLL